MCALLLLYAAVPVSCCIRTMQCNDVMGKMCCAFLPMLMDEDDMELNDMRNLTKTRT